MKSFILFARLLLTGMALNAQTPASQWVRGFGSAYLNSGPSMATDAAGNVYVTGYFTDSTLIFGTDTLINEATNGSQNMFLVKYDSSGNTLWARSAGGGSDEGTERVNAYDLGTDARGNVYVIGSFETPIVIFGRDTLLTNNDYSFLVKYNTQGNAVWAINLGGTLNNADGIVVDANGNSYISGYFTSGSIIGGPDTIPMSGYIKAYVIKYDSSGNSLWAAGISGDNVFNYAVAIDSAANVYITGAYTGDSVNAGPITLTNPGAAGMYTVKYNANGNIAWAQNASVSGDIYPTGISTDGQGNVYVTGNTTSDTLVFGNDTAITGATSALGNIFIARYDSYGTVKWVRSTDGYSDVVSSGISVDVDGNAYITGSFDYASLTLGETTLVNNDTLDESQALFIAKYDPSGNVVWAIGGEATKYDVDGGGAIKADNNGHLYVSGSYGGPDFFFGNDSLPFAGVIGFQSNIFVAKYALGQTNAGINDPVSTVNALTAYPNPSSGQFYFKGLTIGSTLEVYDLLGQRVCSSVTTADNYSLNISSRAKGIYFYRVVESDTAVQQGKIIVE